MHKTTIRTVGKVATLLSVFIFALTAVPNLKANSMSLLNNVATEVTLNSAVGQQSATQQSVTQVAGERSKTSLQRQNEKIRAGWKAGIHDPLIGKERNALEYIIECFNWLRGGSSKQSPATKE